MKVLQILNQSLIQSDKKSDKLLNEKWSYNEGRRFLKKRIASKNSICLVAEFGNEIVGYLVGSVKKMESWRPVRRTEIEEMFVKENFRSKGVGSRLVRHFLKWSKESKTQRVLVFVYDSNSKGIKFYKKMGFKKDRLAMEMEVR
ncbi:MAG: GNAT family N-acetyltransferase [Candidatus Aenigmarchaeota archaeon]|nr:GNAT family N-acetyltransferase [Candidatus Aenigmarchaeota archaeon]